MLQRNPIQAGLSKGKHTVSHNWKAREGGLQGGVSVLYHPQQHWFHPKLGCVSGRGREEGKGETHKKEKHPPLL